MAERGGEDLPDHGAGDSSDRLDVDGFRARLFGGPGASLYGDSGIPTQSTWDSKEIPVVGAGNSGVAPAGTGGFWGSSVDMFSEHTGGYVSPPEQEDSSLVRPYFKTGGRTRPDYDLAIEALVSTSDRGRTPDDSVRPVHRAVCGLCLDTRSVAEIAVHQRLPLGAAKVLIADMAGMGLLLIHQSGVVGSEQPSFEFMERVLSGLRRL